MASWLDWADPKNLPALPTPSGIQQGLEDIVNLALDRSVRLAVTGLRQSGKTVFITALVHHLLSGRELPFFGPVKEKRLLGAKLRPPPGEIPPFPFLGAQAALTGAEPQGPEPTRGLSALRLDLRVANTGFLARQLGDYRAQQVEIIDYPGEWLLDLPMLEASYKGWSEDMIALAESPARATLAGDWLDAIKGLDLHAAADPDQAAALAERYRAYLFRAQAAGMSRLQPGRMTMPGDMAGDPALDFCPLPPADSPPGTIRALMAGRFKAYRDRVVRPFYTEHFSRFDRQIVLVDLLSSLNLGPAVFADTRAALETVLESFRYGASGLLARLFRPRIETLLFAATKADHVAHNQHPNLRQLLEHMVVGPAGHARFEGVQPVFMAIASLRSTDMVKTEHHGQVLSCVRGRLKGEARETVLFPGEIPPELPAPEDWQSVRFRFKDFAPRRLRLTGDDQPQHIRLDQALDVLLGDRLR
jgi:predicted YcjX-like family ATPase